ncbi:MAG: radical SAM protein [Planctomycetota bacterium]|nr:MAG: radical SAM protein [Planctomycetota bacterium]
MSGSPRRIGRPVRGESLRHRMMKMQVAEKRIERLSFDKIFYYPDHLRALVEEREAYPIHMQLGTVNYCNHDCTFCYAARSMFDARQAPRTRIDVERLMEIIEEMVPLGLRSVTLVGSGEPTLHPRVDEIITGLHQRGVDVGLFTNGSCLTDRTLRAIVEHTTFVRFSLTGATREVHDLVHANGDFERVIGNIRRVAQARTGPFPTLGTQFILASYSAGDVVRGAALAKELGMDYYEIKPAYVAPDKPDQLENTLTVADAIPLLEQAKAYEDERFRVYTKMEQVEKVFVNIDDRPYDDCPGHKTTAVLEADLNLYICVNHKVPSMCFGNLTEHSFREVWHGPRRKEILSQLDVHTCVPRCRQDPINRIVHEIRCGDRVIPLNPPAPDPQEHPTFL